MRNRREQEEWKEKLEMHKKRKLQKELEQKLKEHEEEVGKKKEAMKINHEEIKRFHERDQKSLEKYLNDKRRKDEEEERRTQKLESIKLKYHNIERDPERLLKPTIAYTKRLEEVNKRDAQGDIIKKFNTVNIPKRQIPNWRKGL